MPVKVAICILQAGEATALPLLVRRVGPLVSPSTSSQRQFSLIGLPLAGPNLC